MTDVATVSSSSWEEEAHFSNTVMSSSFPLVQFRVPLCQTLETDTASLEQRQMGSQCTESSRPGSVRLELLPSESKEFELYEVIIT